jgi:hypothetical protein
MNDILLALTLIVLHTVDGYEVFINPDEIVMMRPTSEAARGTRNEVVVTGVYCLIGLTNGKFVSVVETCPVVRDAINQTNRMR